MSNSIDYEIIFEVAKEAANLAGAEIRKAMLTPKCDIATKSNSVDLVTETDQKCEDLVTNFLSSKYPTHKIIGEEDMGADGKYNLTDDPTWTIDPIDGTTNFVHRLALTCVLVSFIYEKQTMVGVTLDPMSGEMFWAIKGKGAFMKNFDGIVHPISVSGTTSLQQAVVSMDAGYGREEEAVQKYISVQKAILLKRVRHVRVFGSCGLTMAYVACGRLDAGFEEGSWELNCGPKIWDFSAGKLLVEEAGGVTRDVTGRKSKEDELNLMQRSVFMAGSSELAKELLDTIYDS
mmetsp:Transcript_22853/g.33746  ORF Transcript_22853/g.33746 Transcript_22853/m.33746 type:complete len:290 (-) Transcript_22853:73-942(-)